MLNQVDIQIKGHDFKLQHPGLGNMMKFQDEAQIRNSNGVILVSAVKMAQMILENVVVQPKMDIDDFETKFGEEGQEILSILIDECQLFLERKPVKLLKK